MNRRKFLSATFAAAAASRVQTSAANQPNIPIIDSHIHLFDISRPQGVPWPPKDSTIYKTALPDRLRRLAAPHGVVGAIEVECSPWPADNQWVLDIAAKDSFIVGAIGDLEPGTPGFAQQLAALRKNPLFRGIRYGNIWDRDLGKSLAKPEFVNDLKLLASAGLVLDTANPDPALIRAVVQVTDRVPNLKVIVDHLPELAMPEDASARKACESDFKALGDRPQVFGKISGIVRRVDGRAPLDLAFYRDRLDHIWETFGARRLMYGSDWPNSDQWADYDNVFRLADEFISKKDHASIENFFWKTSKAAYAWVKRDASQPHV